MFSKFRFALGLSLIFTFIFAIPAFAGGWAVITLDEVPTGIVAGEPITIGFTVLQHGKTPMNDLAPTITANLDKEQEFVVDAKPDGKPGHYTATVTFPKDGDWMWSINAFGMEQLMPALNVSASTVAMSGEPVVMSDPVKASMSMINVVRLSALGIGLIGLVIAFRRKSRFAWALTVFCLLIGVGSFVAAPAVQKVEAQGKSSSNVVSKESSLSQVELGRQLFVAKGCITCHTNNKVENASKYWVSNAGPNLTSFSASPEVLHIRLKNPVDAKSDTQMPNLHLSETEIEALIAFINSE